MATQNITMTLGIPEAPWSDVLHIGEKKGHNYSKVMQQ